MFCCCGSFFVSVTILFSYGKKMKVELARLEGTVIVLADFVVVVVDIVVVVVVDIVVVLVNVVVLGPAC